MSDHRNTFAPRASVINESLIYVSYHNIDIAYAFQFSTLLIRYYRNIWLDRFEIDLTEDWSAKTHEARSQATGVIVIVTDDYLESPYCRAEFEYFRERGLTLTAVIPRDFSTEAIADFSFSDWIDFRRWFDEPNDLSVENLLSQVPQSESVAETGERLDYLRGFVQDIELALAKMPTSWASLRNADARGAPDIRPRAYLANMLTDWEFTCEKAGTSLPLENLLEWAESERKFVLRGETGSGKTFFARLLALQQAHAALHKAGAAVPLWLDLAQWRAEQRSLSGFIESQWRLVSYWQHWLAQNRALIVLDNWSDFARTHPARVAEATTWIDSGSDHRFIVLSDQRVDAAPNLPAIQIKALDAGRAQNFVGGFLSLEQQNSFRQILKQKSALIENSHMDDLSIGVELLSAERALAFNQWQSNPTRALISLRSHQAPLSNGGLDANQLLIGLQQLAWSMMLQSQHRFLRQDSAISRSIDPRIIDRAKELGILNEAGVNLSFCSERFQWYLAAENLKQDGLNKVLTRPEFAAGRGRIPNKWDNLALVVVDELADESRLEMVEQIAEVDPFIAALCLKRYPALYAGCQELLIEKLSALCAQNPAAQSAFRSAIAGLPKADKTAELLIAQLSRFNNAQQLWLWQEIRALPIELPVAFIQLVRDIDRGNPQAALDDLKPYGLSLALAYLVKLTGHQDKDYRGNAIWLLGELKYLPTAILLLGYLEDGDGNDHDEVILALMKYAYSELLLRVLRWSQDHRRHRPVVIRALAERKRLVTSRLLAFADARRLTPGPDFYEFIVHTDEQDIAIGLAQIAADHVELPGEVEAALGADHRAVESSARVAASIKHWPNREGFQQLVADISQVLADPPESTIAAGSNLEALLYGEPLFDDMRAQSEAAPKNALPAPLLAQLRHEDWQERRSALEALVDRPASAALPPLLEAAHDEDERVRLAAYDVLTQFANEEAAQKALVAALADPQSAIVAAVTELLKSIRELDCEALLDLLDSAYPATVAAAIELLGHARYRPAAAVLRQLLNDERRPDHGDAAIGQRAGQALSAIDASVMDGEQRAAGPGAGSGFAAESDSRAFTDEEKIARTLKVLRDDDWGRTQKAAKFLRKFARHLRGAENPQILRLLCEALNDANWSVRWAAAEALAMLRDPAAIPALSARVDDQSWIVQVAAVRTLVELGATGLAAKMTPLLQSARKAVREAAAEALGEMGDAQTLPALSESLKHDGDEFVRFAALKALAQIDPAGARPHFELALSDSSVHLRWFALWQLAPQMTEIDLPILKQLLDDHDKPSGENESVHDLAAMTLRRIGTDECLALLDADALAEKRAGV